MRTTSIMKLILIVLLTLGSFHAVHSVVSRKWGNTTGTPTATRFFSSVPSWEFTFPEVNKCTIYNLKQIQLIFNLFSFRRMHISDKVFKYWVSCTETKILNIHQRLLL